MPASRLLLLVALTGTASAANLAAQEAGTLSIEPEERTRVEYVVTDSMQRVVADRVLRGAFVRLDADRILVANGDPPVERSIALDDVRRIEVARGSAALKGLGYGLLIGAGAGFLLGFVPDEESGGPDIDGPTFLATFFGFVGGGIGALAGASVERWEEIPMNTMLPEALE